MEHPIFTSNFWSKAPNKYAVSRSVPAQYSHIGRIPGLDPSFKLLQDYRTRKIDEQRYTELYLEQLANKYSSPKELAQILQALTLLMEGPITLCCWEPPGKFCHRHLIANYLKPHLELTEWSPSMLSQLKLPIEGLRP